MLTIAKNLHACREPMATLAWKHIALHHTQPPLPGLMVFDPASNPFPGNAGHPISMGNKD